MQYIEPFILDASVWNNKLSFEEREKLQDWTPSLFIPSIKIWSSSEIEIWEEIVFEEVEDGVIKSCRWLKNFIRLWDSPIPTTIFDNHNHALYFWIESIHEGILKPWFELIHIDEHSDLWPNEFHLDTERALRDLNYAWEFTNFSCNVGNYIVPAKESGIIWNMIRIENDFQVDEYMEYLPWENTVLNIDLDFFAPEMEFIDDEKKYRLIRHLMTKVSCITIATSPFFIDQKRAISTLSKILSS
jgi:UPF0489 domain